MEAILQTRRNERIRGLGKKRECTKRRIDHRMYQYLHVQCFYLSSTLHVYKSALTFLTLQCEQIDRNGLIDLVMFIGELRIAWSFVFFAQAIGK